MPPSKAEQRALFNLTDCRLAVGTNKRLGMLLPRTDIMHDSTKAFWLCCCDHAATDPHLMFTSRKVLLERLRNCPTTGLSTKYCVWSAQASGGQAAPKKKKKNRRSKEEVVRQPADEQPADEQAPSGSGGGGGSGSNRPAAAGEEVVAGAEEEAVAARRRRGPSAASAASALELALVSGLQRDCSQLLRRFVALLAWLRAGITRGAAEGFLDQDAVAEGLTQLEQLHSPLARCVALGLRPGSPLFVTEARSLPGRCKSSVDVSLLRPLGQSTREGWPFGAVIQIDGQQHLHGLYCSTSHWIQRNIDCANDLAAWQHCMPVLRIAYSDRHLIPTARRLFVLAVLSNPGASFIMLTRTFYNAMDWDWALRLLRAKWICRLPAHGVFLLCNKQLLLMELEPEVEVEAELGREQGRGAVVAAAAAPGAGVLVPGAATAAAAAAGGPSTSSGSGFAQPLPPPPLRSMYDEPAGPSGLQPIRQWRQKPLEGTSGREGAAEAEAQQQQQQQAEGGTPTARAGQSGPQPHQGVRGRGDVGAGMAEGEEAEEEEGEEEQPELEDEPPPPALFEDLRTFVECNLRRRGAMLAARRRREEEEEATAAAEAEEAVRQAAARARVQAPWGSVAGGGGAQSDGELQALEEGRGSGSEQDEEEGGDEEEWEEEEEGGEGTPHTPAPAPSRRTKSVSGGDARPSRKRGRGADAHARAAPDTQPRRRTPPTQERARTEAAAEAE